MVSCSIRQSIPLSNFPCRINDSQGKKKAIIYLMMIDLIDDVQSYKNEFKSVFTGLSIGFL